MRFAFYFSKRVLAMTIFYFTATGNNKISKKAIYSLFFLLRFEIKKGNIAFFPKSTIYC